MELTQTKSWSAPEIHHCISLLKLVQNTTFNKRKNSSRYFLDMDSIYRWKITKTNQLFSMHKKCALI